MDAITFREAQRSDASSLGALHVASWRETYVNILPDELLEALSVEARSNMWRTVLSGSADWGGTAVFVAEAERSIIGFGACGGQRDEALKGRGFAGEIGAIYVLRSCQRRGVGSSLISLMGRKLLDQGLTSAALWVLRENLPARTFYEGLGGIRVGERDEKLSETTLNEVAYGWSDLSRLIL
jgi:ribosomal protein S18 acetylase RimI-like enzyme